MMSPSVKQVMRYWSFCLGKLAVAGATTMLLVWGLNAWWPRTPGRLRAHVADTSYLLYLVATGVIFLVGVGLTYLAILDQRYRCRVCLRRLRMPIETGSWSKMLQFGRPHIEYICVYGHGKLNIPELHLTGMDNTEWTEHADYWAELCATVDSDDRP